MRKAGRFSVLLLAILHKKIINSRQKRYKIKKETEKKK
jgi:hypothetical protein